jgi:hypothetical protein
MLGFEQGYVLDTFAVSSCPLPSHLIKQYNTISTATPISSWEENNNKTSASANSQIVVALHNAKETSIRVYHYPSLILAHGFLGLSAPHFLSLFLFLFLFVLRFTCPFLLLVSPFSPLLFLPSLSFSLSEQ